MNFVKEHGRTIPVADKVFALSGRAKAAIAAKGKDAVVNATVGALLDDNGDLVLKIIRIIVFAHHIELFQLRDRIAAV